MSDSIEKSAIKNTQQKKTILGSKIIFDDDELSPPSLIKLDF